MRSKTGWQQCEATAFWKDIAHDDHVVQIYEDDSMLLNTLTNYVADGFTSNDGVIVIATQVHLSDLHKRLELLGYNVQNFIRKGQYYPLDAAETLSKFMVNGLPDEKYFLDTISPLVKLARKPGGQIRAFGEMVALLWEHGNNNATILLEQLWNKFCATESLCLFCAYPKSGFSQDASASIMHICTAHTKVIGINADLPTKIEYQKVG